MRFAGCKWKRLLFNDVLRSRLWSDNRQVLGEKIYVYMNDSTIRMAKVEGQALSVEQLDDKKELQSGVF